LTESFWLDGVLPSTFESVVEHHMFRGNTALKMGQRILLLIVAATTALGEPLAAGDSSREQVIKIVVQIQRADYEGNRSALKRLHEELAAFVEDRALGAQVQYWRGFALWRRAMNGFNDKVDSAELRDDMQHALGEFDDAARKDPTFVDAKIGALSCLGFLAFSDPQQDRESPRVQELITRGRQLRKDVEAAAPENPRFFWVMGPMIWYSPPERGGGQEKAMAGYERGLQAIRSQRKAASDALEPSWGEPELLMSLAWSNLNRTTPDLKAAKQEADAALELVPYWYYVRDILIPQIQEAKANQSKKPSDMILDSPRRLTERMSAAESERPPHASSTIPRF
jgi:outer membrane murein-binding lipoprotein Lpp